ALSQLEDAGDVRLDAADRARLKLAALLHDIGHYPFSHSLEEAGLPHHEELAARHLADGELAQRLAELRIPAQRLLPLIQCRAREPLAGLVSGSLDVDKLDYLSRDAWMCGVPYGVIDGDRLLAKRALDLPATELPADTPSWPSDDPDLLERVEDRLARDVGVAPGELFLDFPAKATMLALDLPLVKRDGTVTQLGGAEAAAHLGLPRVAAELYRSARRLRVFVLGEARVDAKRIVELVMMPRDAVIGLVSGERLERSPLTAHL